MPILFPFHFQSPSLNLFQSFPIQFFLPNLITPNLDLEGCLPFIPARPLYQPWKRGGREDGSAVAALGPGGKALGGAREWAVWRRSWPSWSRQSCSWHACSRPSGSTDSRPAPLHAHGHGHSSHPRLRRRPTAPRALIQYLCLSGLRERLRLGQQPAAGGEASRLLGRAGQQRQGPALVRLWDPEVPLQGSAEGYQKLHNDSGPWIIWSCVQGCNGYW
uniref:Uncharacterized protein n=1 Tax=Triticum urartu TaxID=4572 RepID=A0A8R7QEX2_TRIUA